MVYLGRRCSTETAAPAVTCKDGLLLLAGITGEVYLEEKKGNDMSDMNDTKCWYAYGNENGDGPWNDDVDLTMR